MTFLRDEPPGLRRGNSLCYRDQKNYKGRITRATERGNEFLHAKIGNNGEIIAPKRIRDPALQARSFIRQLKEYLTQTADQPFAPLHIEAIAAFTRMAEISEVHDTAAALIYIDELPAAIAAHRSKRFANTPSPWIATRLKQLPRLDLVQDNKGGVVRGRFTDNA